MACATPVVATPGCRSADRPWEEAMVAQDPAEFAQRILDLLDDPQLRHMIGWRGHQYVEMNHDWRAIVTQLEQGYRQALHLGRTLETL
jgi:glycosyltransferase involved in cell wall biosynthesis